MLVLTVLTIFFFSGCKTEEITIEHEIIFEDNAYVRGTTSGAGYINLMEHQEWVANRSSIREITGVRIQYRVTRNRTPSDVTVVFYFGESRADVYLGNAILAQGETHAELQDLSLESSSTQLIDLIMRNNAFWYSIQGNTTSADVDIEPVKITIYGTFEVN